MKAKWQSADGFEYDLLKEFAKENRRNMTEAESAFWSFAKASALGEKCLRQHIIGDYVVDFYFRKSRLIVEIDGGYHNQEEQIHDDRIRQDWLEHMGYKVIRFTNEQVLFDTENTIATIKNLIG